MTNKAGDKKYQIWVVGGGKMGGGLIRGWLAAGLAEPGNITVVEPSADAGKALRTAGVQVVAQAPASSQGIDALVLAVKPQILARVAGELTDQLSGRLVISIAAGISLASLQQLAPKAHWVRAMPNQPVTVGQGATGLFAADEVSGAERALAGALFDAVGQAFWLDNEEQMHALTGLSGSGPAYVALFAEALEDAGVRNGLPRPLASALALQTLAGAAAQMQKQPLAPAELKNAVTSPGGTTIAGVEILEEKRFRAAVIAAVGAATARSRELGEKA